MADSLIEYINNYDNMYGSLHLRTSWHDKRVYLKERYYPGIEVEWTTIAGPLSDETIEKIIATGRVDDDRK